jgi:hypothetical protein
MSKFKGIVVYEILPNGCLNGVYSNNDLATKDEIFNEIARKHPDEGVHGIVGKYTCGYIDLNNQLHECILQITSITNTANNFQYEFVWHDKISNAIKWKGIGWRTRDNQITVRYDDK